MTHERRSCLLKIPYPSEEYALKRRKEIVKQGSMGNFTGLVAYKCLYCPHWHLGHNRKRRAR